MTNDTILTALAPAPETFEEDWSREALAGILATDRLAAARRRRARRATLVGAAVGAITLSTAAAVASGGPADAVKDLLHQFIEQPNTTGNGLGELRDPELVAQFPLEHGVFALWVATPTSADGVCFAYADGTWDGTGTPTADQLDYGCGGEIVGPDQHPVPLTRPDQLGGFFKDADGPLVYGIAPFPDATTVRVSAAGVDRTLPVRADSHGYGATLPEAAHVPAVTLTFIDVGGRVLGSKTVYAPVG
ncbi:MAG: hypothetical protein J7518_03975 [Nocardioidaceae bacterium]|nr:hypothetical protein [Nocardioidaceae bacterium]